MVGVPGSARSLYPTHASNDDPRRWLYAGVAALLVLIGVAVVLAVAVPLYRGQAVSWDLGSAPWNWVVGLLGLLIAVWLLVAFFRVFAWGISGDPYGWRGHHRYYHRYYRDWEPGLDPAMLAARERYARGEISKEQFDQIVRDLSGGGPGLPP